MRSPAFAGTATRVLPSALLAAAAWGLAWQAGGSTDAVDWLPYAAGALLLAAAVLSAGVGLPARSAGLAVAALGGLAAWAFVSHWWSASPALARDEALLTALYAVALLLPLVTLRTGLDRLVAVGLVGLGAASLALAVLLALLLGHDPAGHFVEGRLAFPVSYINAQAAAFLLGWWPAVALAAHRRLPVLVRALSLGAAALVGAAALLCQSKGAELGLALSALAVFAVTSGRLRLLVPTLIAGVLDAAAIAPLTAPYRASAAGLGSSVRHAAAVALLVGGAGLVLGAAYALADRRLELSERAGRVAGRITFALVLLTAAGGLAALLLVPAHPLGAIQDRWESFKTPPQTETTSSHLLSLGSYRYDTWRVALHEFRQHPVAGIGSRGFGPAYLVGRHIARTPQHAHSLELETMSDEGLVGLLLLLLAIGIPLVRAGAGSRRRLLPAVAALGGCAYWLLHASADWLWSFPAIGVPFFLLLGIGASWGDAPRPIARRTGLAAAAACVALLVAVVLPTWTAGRLVLDAQRHPDRAGGDLRWARRLDPLSTQVLVTRAALTGSYEEQIGSLRTAVSMAPRQAALRYLLGVVELNGGRHAEARAELTRALALAPGDPLIEAALALAAKG